MTKEEFEVLLDSSILGAVISSSYDGFSYTNEKGDILYCNRAYYQITDLPEGSIAGHSVYDLAKEGYPVSAMTIKVMETRQNLTEVIRYHPSSAHEVLVTMVPVYDQITKDFIGTVANYRDLTALNDERSSLELIELKYQETLARKYAETERLWKKLYALESNLTDFNIVGKSRQMRDLMELARRICHADSTVLITGESGVGKDVFCRMVRYFSGKNIPYIKISCGAIPENLLESELFGYEAGAFTGASRTGKQGIFELADGGIVFLDEIGEMPLQLQVKLLTVLQDHNYFRVGGTKNIELKARIIAATNKDLKQMMAEGTFREDLYYRLNVIPVSIPPLRERKEDILPLADHILLRLNQKGNTNKVFSREVQSLLKRYNWPGNIRELNNVVERMYVLSRSDMIDLSQVPEELFALAEQANLLHHLPKESTLKEAMETVEATLIQRCMDERRTLKEIAQQLGIDLSTLERKLKKYSIPRRYRR